MMQSPQFQTTIAPFIDGEFTLSFSEDRLQGYNPANGQVITDIPAGSAEDIHRAVTSSREAFEDGRWSGLSPEERSAILQRFAELIEADAETLDRLDALDMGKPVSLGLANAAAAAEKVRVNAEALHYIMGDTVNGGANNLIMQARHPRGVVGAIVPWNFPTTNAIGKCAPALAAGNCVLLKPSECATQSSIRLVQLAIEAGIPPGVFNLVPGRGDTVGRALALAPDIDMLAFTGSTAVGKLMLQYAGQSNMKLVHAECGGKSPQIVFPDYDDLDTVADHVSQLILVNQGQLCVTGSRLLVHRDIEKALTEKIAQRFSQVTIGDPANSETGFGPLANQHQMQRVLDYIQAGSKSGAQLVTGGQRVLRESGGYFVEPTLFNQVDPNAPLAQQEIFGPVLTVTSFNTTREAQQLANATPYGLAAYIWTRDLNTGLSLAKGTRAGMVTVNSADPSGAWPAALSIEPYGHSGVGVEVGLAGLEAYTRRQVMWFNHG